MADDGSKDFSRFGPELRRVRAGERATDDGGKKVWHQAATDIEIISFVDATGKVTRQECFTSGTLVVWRPGQQIETGSVSSGARAARVDGSDTLVPDVEPNLRAVEQSLSLIRAAPRGDKYLDHFLIELEAAATGLSADADDNVTSSLLRPVQRVPPKKKPLLSPQLLVGAAVGVLALGILIWRATR